MKIPVPRHGTPEKAQQIQPSTALRLRKSLLAIRMTGRLPRRLSRGRQARQPGELDPNQHAASFPPCPDCGLLNERASQASRASRISNR